MREILDASYSSKNVFILLEDVPKTTLFKDLAIPSKFKLALVRLDPSEKDWETRVEKSA